jgi:toxin ParE1/3/4
VARLRLSAEARADLTEIEEYGAERFGDEAAAAYLRGFNKVSAQLRRYPLSAMARDDYGDGVRCLTHGSHRIVYIFDGEEVLIVRILHHTRDVRKALGQ